ncbi:MAG: C-GCAxxG-C-C family protein [Candidatus Gastranaerophilales bacterium]|nr:C-GCAxxG-C-C family protein [Candidatus Gastranaerophilales bacterium]
MKEIAVKYFLSGYSCSESVVQAAIDKGYIKEDILAIATPFSGGMGIKCLCGAVAGAQIVIGSLFGKNKDKDGMTARKLAKEFNEKFSQKYKVNCCKILSAGFADFHSLERRQHCSNLVKDSSEILETILKENLVRL